MCLLTAGLSGITCGPGYGEWKPFDPVSGGLPAAKFYLQKTHLRHSVLDAYDLLVRNKLGQTKDEFSHDVCGCPICNAGIKGGNQDLIRYYGELSEARLGLRRYPTSKAVERCFYHYLFSKLIEYRRYRTQDIKDMLTEIDACVEACQATPEATGHLRRWRESLGTAVPVQK